MSGYKVAFFTHDSIQEGVGKSQILALCSKLAVAGNQITLYSFEKQNVDTELIQLVKKQNIEWIWFPFKSGGIYQSYKRIRQLQKIDREFDLIHARGDLPAFAAVLRKKERVIWDIRSLWVLQRRILDRKRFNKFVIFAVNRICQYTSKRVAGYNTLSHAVKEDIVKIYPKMPMHNAVVSTCVDTDYFLFKPKVQKNPIALLSGTYNEIYDSILIREFVSYMKTNYENQVLWAKGAESLSKELDLGQDEVKILDYEDMPDVIENSSYGIAVCKNNLGISLKAAMPTKIAEFLAIGRPVVVNSNLGDVRRLLIEEGVALALDNFSDIPVVAKNLTEMISDPLVQSKCRSVALSYFSLEKAAESYMNLYDKVTGS